MPNRSNIAPVVFTSCKPGFSYYSDSYWWLTELPYYWFKVGFLSNFFSYWSNTKGNQSKFEMIIATTNKEETYKKYRLDDAFDDLPFQLVWKRIIHFLRFLLKSYIMWSVLKQFNKYLNTYYGNNCWFSVTDLHSKILDAPCRSNFLHWYPLWGWRPHLGDPGSVAGFNWWKLCLKVLSTFHKFI